MIITGLTTIGGLILPGCAKKPPPTYGNILRMGDAFTYHAQRALLPGQSLVKEYTTNDISSFPAIGTTNPADTSKSSFSKPYENIVRAGFKDYCLAIEGRVSKPGSYTLTDLQKFPARKQITRHTCEEGWSAIAEWTGVPLASILNSAGTLPSARFVNFYSYDGWVDSIDLLDAFHPQTILAYGMNGRDLPIPHGGPLRLRVETQLGYKSMKYLEKITVTDEFVDIGDIGWSWHAGI